VGGREPESLTEGIRDGTEAVFQLELVALPAAYYSSTSDPFAERMTTVIGGAV
jgi:hypothetical protein